MNERYRYNLKQLFGVYLHQNWHDFYSTPKEAVADFLNEALTTEIEDVLEALIWLINQRDSEEQLRETLYRLSNGYYPPGVGKTYQQWLIEVYNQILKSSGKSPTVDTGLKAQKVVEEDLRKSKEAKLQAEQQRLKASQLAQQQKTENSINEGFTNIGLSILLAIISYPIVGFVGCNVRNIMTDHIHRKGMLGDNGLVAWSTEALYIPIAIILIGILSAVINIIRKK